MVEIGKFNKLEIVKEVDFGVYLDGDKYGEILLPKQYLKPEYKIGSIIDVFLYYDSEDRLIATNLTPKGVVGEFVLLKAIAVNDFGAFMDWGLPKDLFIPFREQKHAIRKGQEYLVYIYFDDKSSRLAGSTRFNKFLSNDENDFYEGDEVDLLIAEETHLGFNAIINLSHIGIIYRNEIFQEIQIGQTMRGFIKKVRMDNKIDLSLYRTGYLKVEPLSQTFIDILKQNNNFLPLNDNSSPEDIYKVFSVSKKTFKKTIGLLFKERIIEITDEGIKLIK